MRPVTAISDEPRRAGGKGTSKKLREPSKRTAVHRRISFESCILAAYSHRAIGPPAALGTVA